MPACPDARGLHRALEHSIAIAEGRRSHIVAAKICPGTDEHRCEPVLRRSRRSPHLGVRRRPLLGGRQRDRLVHRRRLERLAAARFAHQLPLLVMCHAKSDHFNRQLTKIGLNEAPARLQSTLSGFQKGEMLPMQLLRLSAPCRAADAESQLSRKAK